MRRVADDLGGFVGGEGIGKVPKPPLHVSPECAPALVRNGNEAFTNIHGIHRAIIIDHHRLLGRLGIEDPHGDLLTPIWLAVVLVYPCVKKSSDASFMISSLV